MLKERIFELVRRKGPCLPIEVAKEVGCDSFIASAFLATLVKEGKVKMSKRKYGASPLYYVVGQELRVRQRLLETLSDREKALLEFIRKKRIITEDELGPAEKFLLSRLKDFVEEFQIDLEGKIVRGWKYWNVSKEELERKFKPRKKVEKPREAKKVEIRREKEIKQPKPGLPFNVVGEVKLGGKRYKIVRIKTEFGFQDYILIEVKKKKIGEGDLRKIKGLIIDSGYPVLILTQATLTKNALDYYHGMKNLVHILKVDKM